MTTVGSYCVVFDTVVEDLPAGTGPKRPWGPGNNPKTAVHAYLQRHPGFVVDTAMDNKLLTSVAPNGFLRRLR
jgi:cephalosporin hydroxylase